MAATKAKIEFGQATKKLEEAAGKVAQLESLRQQIEDKIRELEVGPVGENPFKTALKTLSGSMPDLSVSASTDLDVLETELDELEDEVRGAEEEVVSAEEELKVAETALVDATVAV